ncbi:tumor necrosis factor ligand superfamily member 15 isoform X2 [Lithobates pipiens]
MAGNVEVGVDMLPEEMTRRLIMVQRAQDGRLRRLQWAVTVSSVCLLGLFGLTLYQTFGNLPPPPPPPPSNPDKTERSPQMCGLQNLKDMKPKAHLTGKSQLNAEPKDTFLQWESNSGLAFVKDGMKYENKSIHIPKRGYYFVYAQVSLKIPQSFEHHFVSEIIKVNDNYGDPEVLFSGKIPKNSQQTIYLAGLLELTRGDRLKVNVSSVDHIDISLEHKTYFGAFWVMDFTGR